jgi:hypothetical protein
MWVSDALPQLAKQADDLALIRSMFTTNLTHEPAIYLIQSGKMGPGRPTLGAWTVYGLGSENQDLPAFVVLFALVIALEVRRGTERVAARRVAAARM